MLAILFSLKSMETLENGLQTHSGATPLFLKVCSHLTFAFAFASTSPSKFNTASMVTQTQTHRMGLNPFLKFYMDAMSNIDANANVNCEQTLMTAVSIASSQS